MTIWPDAFFGAHTVADGHILRIIILPWRSASGVVSAARQIMIGGHIVERWNPMAKPTASGLGVDLASLEWQRSGAGNGSFEVAFVASQTRSQRAAAGMAPGARLGREAGSDCPVIDWVLLRVAGDPAGRVLVYDRNEWLCFLDGAVRGEFDWRQE
jgi:hypothetical protein